MFIAYLFSIAFYCSYTFFDITLYNIINQEAHFEKSNANPKRQIGANTYLTPLLGKVE